jgi:hypothetical protein
VPVKLNKMILKYIEEEHSINGPYLLQSNNKFKSDWKWLAYFTNNCSPSLSFVEKMDLALKEQFNVKIGKEIDWSQVWLFVEPTRNQLSLCQFPDDNKKFYLLRCYLMYDKLNISYNGSIMWGNKKDFSEFNYWKDVIDLDIHFEWIPDEDNNLETLEKFPCIDDKESRSVSKKLKIKAKFPVSSVLDSMPHEGQFGITLWNDDDIEKVSEVFEDARSDWNSQTDIARETGDESLERGYCHNISFNTLDEKVGYWYIDLGSAADGIYEFLL